MTYNSLIFGKNQLERIVSIEINEDIIEIFLEDKNGNVQYEWMPNKYWVLSHRPMGPEWSELKGNQWYGYGKKYTDRKQWAKDRYNKAFDTFSISNEKEAAMILNGLTYFKGMKTNEVSILSFDIETTTLEHNNDARVLLISNTFRKNGVTERRLFAHDEFKSDSEMLEAWCGWVRERNPAIICGHNIFGYDLPYLRYCADKNNVQLKLGRDDSALFISDKESAFRVDGSKDIHYNRSYIYGREIIDTMFLSYRYDVSRKYDNYKLKYIVKYEGLEIKDRQFYDAVTIKNNFQNPEEWKKIKQYCIHDADDALALYDLMIPSYFYMTQSVPKSFQSMLQSATGSQINAMLIRAYLQDGHSIPKTSEVDRYEGALSDGFPGIYKNVLKFDVASLYPSIMREYQVYDKMKDPKGYFLQIVEYFATERLANKKKAKETGDKYFKDLEQSQKIFANSMYGLLGAAGLCFNSVYNAAFVTRKGREILKQAIFWATGKIYEKEATL